MRTWFQCMRKFIKFGSQYYYVDSRYAHTTKLIRNDVWIVFMLNEEFDGLLRCNLIELLPE